MAIGRFTWVLVNKGNCTGGCIRIIDVYNSITFPTADGINSVIGTIPCRQSYVQVLVYLLLSVAV
jgi:hypothetical protein